MFVLKKVMTLCKLAGTRTHLLLRASVGMLHSQFVVTVTITIIQSTFNFTFLRNKFADVQHLKDLVSKFDDFLAVPLLLLRIRPAHLGSGVRFSKAPKSHL